MTFNEGTAIVLTRHQKQESNFPSCTQVMDYNWKFQFTGISGCYMLFFLAPPEGFVGSLGYISLGYISKDICILD